MASIFSFGEDSGPATGSPAKGATRAYGRTECNWKNATGLSDVYSTYPIQAGNNSYTKFQFGAISGTWNTLSNGKFAHTTGTFGAGLTLRIFITSGYATPETGTLTSGIDFTVPYTLAASGLTVYLNSGGPEYASGTSITTAGTGFTSYLVTQLQTTTGASPGDTTQVTLSFSYDES